MGIKGLHAFLRKHGRIQTKDITKELHSYHPGILYIDVCCVLHDLLAPYAEKLFRAANDGSDIESNIKDIEDTIKVDDLVNDILGKVELLQQKSHLNRVCLVFDGDKLKAKGATHSARSNTRKQAFKKARRILRRGIKTSRQQKKFHKETKRWISWSTAIKKSVMAMLEKRGIKAYNPNDDCQGVFFHQAPYEADSEIIFLCDQFRHEERPGAIMSWDGDLFAYGGAVDTPRIIKMNWDKFTGIITTKRALLSALNYRTENHEAIATGEVWFAVLAATSGNDYAPNVPSKSFLSIAKALEDLKGFTGQADHLLELLMSRINVNNDSYITRFRVALHQYCCPIVTNFGASSSQESRVRWNKIPIRADNCILSFVDGPHHISNANPPRQDDSMYTLFNTASIENVKLADEKLSPLEPPSKKQEVKKGKGKVTQSKPSTTSSSKHPSAKVTEASRYVSTMQAGLYSSVLSAAMARHEKDGSNGDSLALQETELLVQSLRQLVSDVSYSRMVALHIVNIAIRIAGNLDPSTAESFYEYFFLDSKSEQSNIWHWILLCGTHYTPARRGASQQMRDGYKDTKYIATTDILDRHGDLREDLDDSIFKAYGDDDGYVHLIKLMQKRVLMRNVLLTARKVYFNGQHDPMLPECNYLTALLDQLAVVLNTNFRVNIVLHFKQRYIMYLGWRLKELARVPNGWPGHQEFLDALYATIDDHLKKKDTTSPLGSHFNRVDLSARIRLQVTQFVHNVVKRHLSAHTPFTRDLLQFYLCQHASTPEGWPTGELFKKYLFWRIWGIPFDESIEDMDDDDEPDADMKKMLAKLPVAVKDVINEFVIGEKRVKAGKLPIADLDLAVCLGVKQTVSRKQDVSLPKERKRPEDDTEGEVLDDYEEMIRDVEAEDDGAEADDTGNFFFAGKPSRGKGAPLLAISMNILERYPGIISFAICPVAPCRTISLPISKTFANQFLGHLDHFSRHFIKNLKDERHNSKSLSERHRLDTVIVNMEGAKERFKGTTTRDDPFGIIFDIKSIAFVTKNGKVKKQKRHYHRTLRQLLPGTRDPNPRYTPKGIFRTDGVCVQALFTDWKRRRRENQYAKYLTEMRRSVPETLSVSWHHNSSSSPPNILHHYAGVVGLDFGEVCSVASVFRPSNPAFKSSQLIIKRGFLYGKDIPNRDWLLNRKAHQDIEVLESALSEGSTRSDFKLYTTYIKTLREGNRGNILFRFYSSTAVRRKVWDSKISQQSCLDTACTLILNQHRKTVTGAHANKPVLFGFGLDGIRKTSRKGARRSKDTRLANKLHAKIKQGNTHHSTRVCEYNTSQMCCHCVKRGETIKAGYLQRIKPSNPNTMQQSFRVLVCSKCHHVTHRDGNAADNQAIILQTMLQHYKRPQCFIPPRRRIAPPPH